MALYRVKFKAANNPTDLGNDGEVQVATSTEAEALERFWAWARENGLKRVRDVEATRRGWDT